VLVRIRYSSTIIAFVRDGGRVYGDDTDTGDEAAAAATAAIVVVVVVIAVVVRFIWVRGL